jgi:hypothetical protein
MELFRTLVPVPVSETKVRYGSQIVMTGSCFSEYIGDKLSEARLTIDNNPFGIVYNPLSVGRGLMRLLEARQYVPDDLFQCEQVWCSFDHHSRFSDPDKGKCLEKINSRLQKASLAVKSADILFLTFGSSYVYWLKSSGEVVANCHKVPAREFDRRRISADDIVKQYDAVLQQLFQVNPGIHVVFTVSPIRHWKDGAHENQLSKATLLLAIDEICRQHKQTLYFPSYEIVMDELRDYRFFDEDMLHPNKIAITYIWGRFKECFMDTETIALMKEVEKIVQATKHRPFNINTDAFQSFARQFYDKVRYLKGQYKIELTDEENYFKQYC